MKIKFNNIQDLADARYASAAMAEWIGFRLDQLPIAQVQEIVGWCAGPKITLELYNKDLAQTAISWCTLLEVETIECPESDLKFWQTTLSNPKLEWLTADSNGILSSNIDQHIKIYPVNPLFQSPTEIVSLNLNGLSLNCEKATPVGPKKNYDTWNELLETLDIW